MFNKPNDWETGLIGGVEKRVIKIVPYSQNWPIQFQNHAKRIKNALGSVALRIEHIGSTSVEELAAKPIIDILVVIADPSQEELYLPALVDAGYELRVREPEYDNHRMFRTPERDVHIHIYPPHSEEVERYLLFRDFLRNNPRVRGEYANLKQKLSESNWKDMNEYSSAKTSFIDGVINQAKKTSERLR